MSIKLKVYLQPELKIHFFFSLRLHGLNLRVN